MTVISIAQPANRLAPFFYFFICVQILNPQRKFVRQEMVMEAVRGAVFLDNANREVIRGSTVIAAIYF